MASGVIVYTYGIHNGTPHWSDTKFNVHKKILHPFKTYLQPFFVSKKAEKRGQNNCFQHHVSDWHLSIDLFLSQFYGVKGIDL